MKDWKLAISQILIAAIIAVLAVKVFVVPPRIKPHNFEEIENRLSEKIGNLEKQVSSLSDGSHWQATSDNLKHIEQLLKSIESRIAQMESQIKSQQSIAKLAPVPFQQSIPPGNSTAQPIMPRIAGKMNDWRADLTPEQKVEVDALFKAHATRFAEIVRRPPMGSIPDPEEMKIALEREIEKFQSEMEQLLTPDQYVSFIKSMPQKNGLFAPID